MELITLFVYACVFVASVWLFFGVARKAAVKRVYGAPWLAMFQAHWTPFQADDGDGWHVVFGSFTAWPSRPHVAWLAEGDEALATECADEWNTHHIRPSDLPKNPLFVIGEGGSRRVVDLFEKWSYDNADA